ncbi:MAG: AHH domain-containing protein [Polyangiaceae bacterium]|nr:AHH domain-containing protein [Polyangiaceae bacterium]
MIDMQSRSFRHVKRAICSISGILRRFDISNRFDARFKIGLDEAVNGVFLPATKNSPNPLGSQVHRPLSNMEAYYKKVNDALEGLKTKQEVIAKLRDIADPLTKGTFL